MLQLPSHKKMDEVKWQRDVYNFQVNTQNCKQKHKQTTDMTQSLSQCQGGRNESKLNVIKSADFSALWRHSGDKTVLSIQRGNAAAQNQISERNVRRQRLHLTKHKDK